MKLVFNTLSLRNLDNVDQIVQSLENLFKIRRKLKNNDEMVFLFHSNIQSYTLSCQKSFMEFLSENKNDENSEYLEYLVYHIVNVPFIDEIINNLNLEVFVENDNFQGFKIVYEDHDFALKSFFTEELWEDFTINCEVEKLNNNAEIERIDSQINNIGNLKNINEQTWIYPFLLNLSLELFTTEISFLKNIVLSESVIQSIKSYGNNLSLLGSLLDSLQILDGYCSNFWKFGEIRLSLIKELGVTTIKPESNETLKKFGSERKFTDVDGKKSKYPFTVHFNLPDDKRCYIKGFVDESGIRKIFVAYVGKHLRTVKFD
ncbi:MAG: hypothetical protein O2793_06130 [Proteobacteria bacterium]|nr:hypothetical protein [Pseudomonadota bacterium]MDA1254759.1 hypothetical protein [Pseudomonadota bacterium]